MLIEIKSWITGSILYSCDADDLKSAIIAAVRSRADLSGADLSGVDLSWVDLSWADLSGADLSEANLSWVDLSGTNLSRANLSGANLSWTNLSWAKLSCANLSGANLSGADLSGGNLSGADLSGANLSGVDLSCANLSGTNLDLKHCYLSISPIGSENGRLWMMKNEKGILIYNRGCFSGTEDEFRAAIDQKHGNSEYAKKYYAAIDFIKNQLGDRL